VTGTPPLVTPFTGAPPAALSLFVVAVLDVRDGFRDSVKLCSERAGAQAADPIRAALCRGQAMAYEAAAEHIDEALSVATGRWTATREAVT